MLRPEFVIEHFENLILKSQILEEGFFYLLFYYYIGREPSQLEVTERFNISNSSYYHCKNQLREVVDFSLAPVWPANIEAWEQEKEFFAEVKTLRKQSPKLTYKGFKILFFSMKDGVPLDRHKANQLGVSTAQYYRIKKGALSRLYGENKSLPP